MLQQLVKKLRTAEKVFRRGDLSDVVARVQTNIKILAAKVAGAKLDGCRFKCPGVPEEIWRTLVSGAYESSERECLRRYLDRRSPVVELGGCLGVVSCITNKMLDSPCTHVVVEANPKLLPIIKANAARNGCNFTLVNAALAYGRDQVTLWVDNNQPYSSSLFPVRAETKPVAVPATSLLELFKQNGIANCTLVCDIEGAEYDMVLNELPVISAQVSLLILEVHQQLIGQTRVQEMLTRLATAGFENLAVIGDVHVLSHR